MLAGSAFVTGMAVPCIGHSVPAALSLRISEPGVHGLGPYQGPCRLYLLPVHSCPRTRPPTPALHAYSAAPEDMGRPQGHQLDPPPTLFRHRQLTSTLWVAVGEG